CELDDVVGDDVGVGSERVDEVGDELLERRRAIEALPDDRPDRVEPVDEQPPVVALGRGDHRFAVDLDERHVGPRPGHEEAVDLGGLDHASSPPLPALDARAASGCTSSVGSLHAMAAGSSSRTTAARPSSARCTSPRPPPPSSAPNVTPWTRSSPEPGSTRWLDRWVRRPRTTRRASRVRTTDAELRYRKWKPVAAPDADGSPSCTE